SDLESRFSINMNVLDAKATPRVMGLKEALQAFLAHRREVIVRRARFRLAKIEQRLHILAGLLIVFLNLDEVIRIVRFEDEAKAKLEERELRREHADLAEERDGIQGMLASDKQQWKLVGAGLRHVREVLGPN